MQNILKVRNVINNNVSKSFSVLQQKQVLPDLNYDPGELQPVLSAQTLEFHHGKHHQTYVNNINNILNEMASDSCDVKKFSTLQAGFRFNMGGHSNHTLYWDILSPVNKKGGQLPDNSSPLTRQIVQQYGSYENMITLFKQKAVAVQGSGWGWLGWDNKNQVLRVFELPNQDMPEWQGIIPILGIDVWEHAYYLDYQNARPKYMDEIWKIVNWDNVEKRFIEATM